MEKYSINNEKVNILLGWVQSGVVAIPEIQRPFVWKKAQVRDLIDSLYNGYPVGYIITWQNPAVRLKDGTSSHGKQILIDGQQRITALRAAIKGLPVINDKYKEEKIAISFNPYTEEFKVQDSSTRRGSEWIADISEVMVEDFSTRRFISQYDEKNVVEADGEKKPRFTDAELDLIDRNLTKLLQIKNKEIGNIVLSSELPIDIVNDIFIRINQKGTKLSNADFVMSKIAVYEREQGDEYGMNLRKFLDYFCNLAVEPMQYKDIEKNDTKFTSTNYYQHIAWLKNETSDLYDPEYSDILQTILALQFDRNKLGELVSLLSGRDFEQRIDLKEIADDSFAKLEEGIYKYTREHNFKHFIEDILMASGYGDKSILTAKGAINYLYGIYLRLRDIEDINTETLSKLRRLFVISLLKSRLTGSSLAFSEDFKRIKKPGDLTKFVDTLEMQELTEVYWTSTLPDEFDKTNTSNQFWNVFVAAQRKLNYHGFLTPQLKVADMTTPNIHHIFPRSYLIAQGLDKDSYNKIANFVYLRDDVNKKLDDDAPKVYLEKVRKFDGAFNNEIDSEESLARNLKENAIPESVVNYDIANYEKFLEERRKEMAKLVKDYYYSL
ncbi:DUF262 domain-containing protein [Candidatus Saccharibacteria bacterium]|nr:DUF262 domain-containing protein [Candidatus Saccharibacteria bacterium]